MFPHLTRAIVLLQQSRPELADKELAVAAKSCRPTRGGFARARYHAPYSNDGVRFDDVPGNVALKK